MARRVSGTFGNTQRQRHDGNDGQVSRTTVQKSKRKCCGPSRTLDMRFWHKEQKKKRRSWCSSHVVNVCNCVEVRVGESEGDMLCACVCVCVCV
jgi:hypothetical protein